MVYHEVHWHDKKTRRYRRPPSSLAGSSGMLRGSSTDQSGGISSNMLRGSSTDQVGGISSIALHGPSNEHGGGISSNAGIQETIDEHTSPSQHKVTSNLFSVLGFHKKKKNRHPRTQEVFEQAVLYVLAFYFTHVWSTTNRIIQQVHPGRIYYPLAVIHAFVKPLQGFINFLVYQRPRYRLIREQRPELSYFQIIRRVLRFSCLKPLDGGTGHTNHSSQSRVEVRGSHIESTMFNRDEVKKWQLNEMMEGSSYSYSDHQIASDVEYITANPGSKVVETTSTASNPALLMNKGCTGCTATSVDRRFAKLDTLVKVSLLLTRLLGCTCFHTCCVAAIH
jgi:hypothetical protein